VVQVRSRLGDLHDDKAVLLTVQVPPAMRLTASAPENDDARKTDRERVRVERKHAPGPIEVSLTGLPAGVRPRAAVIAKGANSTEVELTADAGAEAVTGQNVTVHVAGDAEAQGEFRLTVQVPPALRVLALAPMTIKVGKTATLKVQVERKHAPGPIEVSLSGLPPGVRPRAAVIAKGGSTTEVELTADPGAEAVTDQRVTVHVAGDAEAQGEFRLTVQVPPALRVLALAPVTVEAGKTITLKVQVERKHAPGPIDVSFPDPPTGVRLRAAVIPKGASSTEVELTADAGAEAVTDRRVAVHVAGDAEAQGEFRLTVRRATVVLKDTNSLGMKFVKVPRGTFWMGRGGGKPGDRQVEIKRDFYLAIHETTQEQWQAVMGSNPSYFSRTGECKDRVKEVSDADLKQFPVENVSWDMVKDFIEKLNAREKGSGWVYRLPTEEEWEYACRGGASSKEECAFDFYFDRPTNDLSSKQANFRGDFPAGNAAKGPFLGRPTKVGSYQPNRLGIYDMHGNAWEWCADTLSGGSVRVFRGGSWSIYGSFCRAALRGVCAPSDRSSYLGFRLARVPSGD
jgi:formylglycine-generating enzyme required for sulfatase activity